jgi:uncharacterized cupin superfamily protein
VPETALSEPRIRVSAAADVDLTPWDPDLTGSCDVLEGPLTMSIGVLWTSADSTTATGVWTCEPSRIRLVHPYDETFVVLEGRMSFTPEGGEARELGPGDVIVIPTGAVNVIEVFETVRKVWTVHAAAGLELG